MKNLIVYIFLTFIFQFPTQVCAQNFEWLGTYKANGLSRVDVRGTFAESNGGAINLVDLSGKTSDSISFGKYKFVIHNTDHSNYLVKVDSSGAVINAVSIGTFDAHHLCGDNEGNFYITGFLTDINLVGTKMLDSSNGSMIFSKFDKNFKLIWVTQTGNSKAINYSEQFSNGKIIFSNKHLYFISMTELSAKIGTTNYSFKGNRTNIYGELNPSNGNIKWSNFFYDQSNTVFQITGLLFLKNKLYFSGDFAGGGNKKAVIGKDTIKDGFVVETDTLGKYQKSFSLSNKFPIEIMCLTTDGVHLYFGGFFMDTLKWGNKKISPQYPTGGPYNRGIKLELFAASITTAFNPRWFFRPKVLDISNQGLSYLTNVKCSNGFLYFGGELGATILIDSTTLVSDGNKSSNWHNVLLIKSDTLGNILWATSGSSKSFGKVNTMDAIADRSVFAGGVFLQRFQLGKFKDSAFNNFGGYITKITDYSITRGKVSAGPYCAGDTIKVPYTKIGTFDTANIFIAELSNEQGNFDGGQRELGRLKSNQDGLVKGILPLFQVSTSKLYRIRIRSTKPAIQSYYITDTLRLLIYSKDKANPGPTETICKGDSIKLNTYGGTKWTWSPKYRMDDSTKRQPWAWPLKDTTYKIIIADSSGCGKPDTAFKKILVRKYPTGHLQFTDTAVCGNITLKIPVSFEGGDSNYQWQWFFVYSKTSWFPSVKGNSKRADTLTYNPTDPQEKLAIILKDGCTAKPDTSYLTITQRKAITITTKFKDTSLCNGNTLIYRAIAKGGVTKQLRYAWKDLITGTNLSTKDSLKITTSKTLKIQLIVNDGCEALGDTAEFTIFVKPPLKAASNLRDTMICSGKTINYTATAQGGDTKAHKFYWVLNSKLIDSTSAISLTSALTSTLSLILKDNCTFPNDTIQKTITIKPSPKADFIYDLACNKTITKFQFTGTKPPSPIITTFRWNFNNEATSSIENPSHQFASTGTSSLILASDNGCTDTIKKIIEIKPQSKAEFTVNDVCESDTAVFINKSLDATAYRWKFGDGQSSMAKNPRHKFQIPSSTTFNVTLVAIVINGCSDSIIKALTINQNPNSNFSALLTGARVDLAASVQGNSKYRWLFGTSDSATTTTGNYTFTLTKPEQYKICLKVTNLASCTSQTCKDITVGISDISIRLRRIIIYPNPNTGSFTIEFEPSKSEKLIEILDQVGQTIYTEEFTKNTHKFDLNLASGMYLVKVTTGGSTLIQRLVVSK